MTQPNSFADGYRLIDGTELNATLANPVWSLDPIQTATAGGTVVTSRKITDTITNVATAAGYAGLTLPQANELGRLLMVINSSSSTIVVYAAGGSTVDGNPGDVGTQIAGNTAAIFTCVNVNEWLKMPFIPFTFTSNNVYIQESIATLRLWNTSAFDSPLQMSLIYNTTLGDGGGLFYLDAADHTTPDNGTTVIVDAAGNRWKREEVNAQFISNLVASLVTIADAGGYYTSSDVEGALQQIGAVIAALPTTAPLAVTTYAVLLTITTAPEYTQATVYDDTVGTTVSRSRTTNVATLTLAAATGLTAGDKVNVVNMTDTSYDGTQVTVLSTPTPTSFTYASTGSDEGTTADAAGNVNRNGVYSSDGAGGWNFLTYSSVDTLTLAVSNLQAQTAGLENSAFNSQTIGAASPAAGTGTSSRYIYIFKDLIGFSGYVTSISAYVTTPVTVEMYEFTINTSNQITAFTNLGQLDFSNVGLNTITNFNPTVSANKRLGFLLTSGTLDYTAGTANYDYVNNSGSGPAIGNTPIIGAGSYLNFNIKVGGARGGLLTATSNDVNTLQADVGNISYLGPTVSSTVTSTDSSTGVRLLNPAATAVGRVVMRVRCSAATTLEIKRAVDNFDGTYTIAESVTKSVVVGLNIIDTGMTAAVGDLFGYHQTAATVTYDTAAPNRGCISIVGNPAIGVATAGTVGGPFTLNVQFEVYAGLFEETYITLQGQIDTINTSISGIPAGGFGTVVYGLPTVIDTALTASTRTYMTYTPLTYDGYLTQFEVACSGNGSITVYELTLDGSGNITAISTLGAASVVAGVNTITSVIAPVTAGNYLGIRSTTSIIRYNTVAPIVGYRYTNASTSAPIVGDTTVGTVGNQIEFNFTVEGAIIGQLDANTADITTLQSSVGASTSFIHAPAAGNATANGGYTWVMPNPVADAGYLTLSVNMAAAVTGQVVRLQSAGGGNYTAVEIVTVNFPGGISSTTAGGMYVNAGEYIGIYTATSAIRYSNVAPAYGIIYYNGLATLGVPTAYTTTGAFDFEIQVTTNSGLFYDVAQLNLSVANSPSGPLSTIDNTGSSDTTTDFSTARSLQPTPYVPSGTFNITSFPYNGQGFWGSDQANVYVNNVRYVLPHSPIVGAVWNRVRGVLYPQITTGSCVIINGDSITNGAYATSLDYTYVSEFCRFLNAGIALDVPIMTNFDNTDTSGNLAFEGVTVSGTLVNGTAGPVSHSLILQPGQVITFTGAYEQIDVTYQRTLTSGTLDFAYNAVSFKTIVCAGAAADDVFTGPSATGQTASGTFTITNTSGTGTVEITSLTRLGVKGAGTANRLYVMRAAHGSYQFTSYGSAQIASMIRIANAQAGGSNHYVVPALGTNDGLAGTSYANMITRVNTYVGYWTAAGVPVLNMTAIMPWRWASDTNGVNLVQYDGGIRQAYKTLGVQMAPTDGIDFVTLGWATDGHPNDQGMAAVCNALVSTLIGEP
jgi:hypothetical protein